MTESRISLCPACDACPEVVVEGSEVRIGEPGNLVVLTKKEWNELVQLIQSGRLAQV